MARPARDQRPLRRRGHDGRQPRDLQERRQGDRAPAGRGRSRSWPSPTTLDRQLLPHPRLAVARRRGRLPRRRASSATTSPAGSRARASSPSSSRRTSTPTSASRPERGRRRRWPGGRQPHVRLPRRRARRRAARRVAHPRRRRQPVPRLRRADRRRAARHRPRARAAAGVEGNAYESDADRFPPTLRDDDRGAREGRSRAPRSATTSSTTTSTTRGPSSGASTQVVTCYERERLFERMT